MALTNVVAFADPLKLTVEVGTKPEPFTVSVNAAPPANALDGEIVPIAGAGLFTVNIWAVLVPPPGVGFVIVTLTGPAADRSAPGTVTVSVVPLAPTVPPVIWLLPKLTVEPATKLEPVSRKEETVWP